MKLAVFVYIWEVSVIGFDLTGTLIFIFFDSSAGSFSLRRARSTSFKFLFSGNILLDDWLEYDIESRISSFDNYFLL